MPRLISAEVLKLRRRRGMLALCALLTLGLTLIVYAVTGLQHALDPAHHGPAGGADTYTGGLGVLTTMAFVVGAVIGATAGAQDLAAGVFRDLAATGRSRTALFTARLAGAWAVVLPLLAVTMVALGALAVALAGDKAAPGAGALAAGTAAILAAGAVSSAMAVGLSVFTGSRGPAIGTLLAFFLALQPALLAVSLLGGARAWLPAAAIDRIGRMDLPDGVPVALGTAVAAAVAWSAALLALGAWRTRTREI